MAVFRMAEADDHLAALLAEQRDLLRREGEMNELDRGGLAFVVGAVLVSLGHALPPLAVELDEGGVLDAAEPRQESRTAHRIVDLEHDGCGQLTAPGNQRIV